MTPDYEAMLEAVYRAALRPGDVAIDVGAHVGRHAGPMAEAVGPTGRVFAYEPLPTAFREIEAAAARSGGVLIARNFAVGEAAGRAEFVHVPEFPEYSGLQDRIHHVEGLRRERIPVDVCALDDAIDAFDAIRFVKLDVEGGELAALRGARRLLAKCRPVLAIEIGDNALVNYPYGAADYADFLEALGYSIFSIFGLPLTRADFLAATREQLFWDYIALPEPGPWPFGHDHLRAPLRQLQAAGAAASAAETRAAAAEAQVEALLASRSWRITAPIRRVARLLSG